MEWIYKDVQHMFSYKDFKIFYKIRKEIIALLFQTSLLLWNLNIYAIKEGNDSESNMIIVQKFKAWFENLETRK